MVTLPDAAFLDQTQIRTICTPVQGAADRCPSAAIYGYATAIRPLLDEPLQARDPIFSPAQIAVTGAPLFARQTGK